MMQRNRGFSLLEMIVTAAISAAVLATGYSLYVGVLKAQDLESQRESMMLTVQNVMGLIKRDVRNGASVSGDQDTLIIDGGRVRYKCQPNGTGIERITKSQGKCIYKGISAKFTLDNGGVRVKLWSNAKVQRRPIRIEVTSFISPRNG